MLSMSGFAVDMGRSSSKGSTRPEAVENDQRSRSGKQGSQGANNKSNTGHHVNNNRHNTTPHNNNNRLNNAATNSLGNVHQSSLSSGNNNARYNSSSTSRDRKDQQLLDCTGRLQKHRRASSDCCLYEVDSPQRKQDTAAAQRSLDKQLLLSSSTSLSRPSTLLTQSRPNSPLAGSVTTLDPRRSGSPSCYSGTTSPHSLSRPVTPVSHHPLAHPHFAHLFQSLEAPHGDRSSSRASVPEILVSDDFGSPSTSTGSSPLSGADFYGCGNEGDYVRKKNHESRSEDIYHSTRRRSPMTGRRTLDSTGTNTPPTSSSSSGTTPLQARARAHSSVTSAAAAAAGTSGSVSSPYTDDLLTHSPNDEWDQDGTGISSAVSNGSGEAAEMLRGASTDVADDTDGSRSAHQHLADKIKEATEHLQSKMVKTRDLIKQEQKARDDNVNEYLKCAASADKLQISRIKAVFEKKNQKSAASIQHLQKKLDTYQKRLQDLQTHGLATQHRQPKEVLRDMGQGLKTGLISKPREFAHLIKNKFGSVDNIKEIVSDEDRDEEKAHHGSATLPPGVSLSSIPPTTNTVAAAAAAANCLLQQPAIAQSGAVPAPSTGPLPTNMNSSGSGGGGVGYHSGGGGGGSSGGGGGAGSGGGPSEEGSECNSSLTSESIPGLPHHGHHLHHHHHLASPRVPVAQDASGVEIGGFLTVEQFLNASHDTRVENDRLREEVDAIKSALMMETNALHERLAEERTRVEQLEQQVNDLTELHQNEMENLKTTITDMEEKVQYQSEERVRDLHEMLENCHTRISRMEHQQAQQQQQFLTLEGLENSNARALFVKLINILLTVLQVLLLVVATAMNIVAPVLQTRGRLITTVLVFSVTVFLYIQMPDLKESFWTFTQKYSWLLS